jgi:hypothetical protein
MDISRVDRSLAHLTRNPEYYDGTVHFQDLHQPREGEPGAEVVAVFF